MADSSSHTQINPHFFMPLLPGFDKHLNIPVAFFSKHIEARNDQNKTAKLRSDASDKTWIVKIDGSRFTDGWKDFAVAHDLRIGDITVFRHEGEMVFHVTALGPSCCEIQYTPPHNKNDYIKEDGPREKRVKKNPRESFFVATVSASSLSNDRLYLPLSFAKSNGLNKMNGKKIILLNEEGRPWSLNLRCNNAGKHTFVKPGFRSFCVANGMGRGQYTFTLVRKYGPPVIRLCHAEHTPESESSSNGSSFVGSVTRSSLDKDKLYLPKWFVNANGLNKGCSEVVLKNERGGTWTLVLKHYASHDFTILKSGWTSFCQVNRIKAGDSFMFKLGGTEENPVLSWFPADSNVNSLSSDPGSEDDGSKSQENEKESAGDKINSKECLENHLVKLTLTPYAFKKCHLILPMWFVRVNGLDKPGKITLLGRDGAKWVVDLLQNKSTKAMRLGKDWREFCVAQGVKIDDSFVLELIWEEEASPVLKFHTILNSV